MYKPSLSPGHTACAGCGQALAARLVADVAGPNVIIANNTGCLEVFSTAYPESSWEVPWIHSLFENAAAVASGVESALRYLGKADQINVIAQAGDGGTADIGLQALSGMWERGHNILSVCYDNEAYMNCLSIASLIMTKKGLKRILEIKVGDEIAAFQQDTHDLVYKKCVGVFDNGIKDIYELKTRYHSIKATANHPFLVLQRNGRGRKNNFVWKKLEEIKARDELVTLKRVKQERSHEFIFHKVEKGDYKVNKINSIEIPAKSSPDLMKYLGIFVGDGWVREEKAEVGFALPEVSLERKEFLALHNGLFKSKLRRDKMYVYVPSVNLARFISSLNFGKGAKNKIIPDWVFTLPRLEKEAFFDVEKVVDIKYIGKEPTLDLRVEDEHNFVADGIVVHNTGVQRSGLTPLDANTTTSPVGSQSLGNIRPKKNMVEIAVAHGLPYVATASSGYPRDIQKKVKKALTIKGPKYLQIHVPCPLGWRHEPELTYEVARLAVETGLYPIIEYEDGKLINVMKFKEIKPVEGYLKAQGRFKHLLAPQAKPELSRIQEIADANVIRYGLQAKGEETK
jgi:pyruvate/2-oxoacid:ferredoxin oxidoreductase beta subunit